MLKFNASEFYRAITALKHIETMLRERGQDKHLEKSDGSVVIEFQDDPIVIGFLREQLDAVQKSLQTLGARQTLKSVDRLLKTVNEGEATGPSLVSSIGEIDSRLKDELSDITLLTLGPKEQDFFEPNEPLFGKEFESKFSSALFELDEAAKCAALGRSTASVFHLMRCMEIGIRAVNLSLGLANPTGFDRNWGKLLQNIKGAMDAKTKTKTWNREDQATFESAYASLDAVRVAWRNTTMHVENKYSPDEAEHIYVAVRGFMKSLASRMDEQGQPLA